MAAIEKITWKSLYFIAPSTQLTDQDRPLLQNAIRFLKEGLGIEKVVLSPNIFTQDKNIFHLSASTEARSREFKAAIREYDVIVSMAGGTGAEDLLLTLDRADYRIIRKRKPLFIGFSDFSFILNEIYSRCRVPGILFPCLRLNEGNAGDLISLIQGKEIIFPGSIWLADPPLDTVRGIPIGGNLTTFVNFLNRLNPPRLGWRDHVLIIEDIDIDLEDLHRLLAALRRHRVFRNIKGLVLGSFAGDLDAPGKGVELQDKVQTFIMAYLAGVLKKRREQGAALPVMVIREFGHNITRGLPAVPIGGSVSISGTLRTVFRLR